MAFNHQDGCEFKNFEFFQYIPDPNGPDQSISFTEYGFQFDSNTTKPDDTKYDFEIKFNFCPVCGCSLKD